MTTPYVIDLLKTLETRAAETLADSSVNNRIISEAYDKLASAQFYLGDYKTAIENFEIAFKHRRDYKLDRENGRMCILAGIGHYRLGGIIQAERFFGYAITAAQQAEAHDLLSIATSNMALVMKQQKHMDIAVAKAEESLQSGRLCMHSASPKINAAQYIELVRVAISVYFAAKEFDKAEDLIMKTRFTKKALLLAGMKCLQNNYKAALPILLACRPMTEAQAGITVLYSTDMMDLEEDKEEPYEFSADESAETQRLDFVLECLVDYNLAIVYIHLNQYTEALKFMEVAEDTLQIMLLQMTNVCVINPAVVDNSERLFKTIVHSPALDSALTSLLVASITITSHAEMQLRTLQMQSSLLLQNGMAKTNDALLIESILQRLQTAISTVKSNPKISIMLELFEHKKDEQPAAAAETPDEDTKGYHYEDDNYDLKLVTEGISSLSHILEHAQGAVSHFPPVTDPLDEVPGGGDDATAATDLQSTDGSKADDKTAKSEKSEKSTKSSGKVPKLKKLSSVSKLMKAVKNSKKKKKESKRSHSTILRAEMYPQIDAGRFSSSEIDRILEWGISVVNGFGYGMLCSGSIVESEHAESDAPLGSAKFKDNIRQVRTSLQTIELKFKPFADVMAGTATDDATVGQKLTVYMLLIQICMYLNLRKDVAAQITKLNEIVDYLQDPLYLALAKRISIDFEEWSNGLGSMQLPSVARLKRYQGVLVQTRAYLAFAEAAGVDKELIADAHKRIINLYTEISSIPDPTGIPMPDADTVQKQFTEMSNDDLDAKENADIMWLKKTSRMRAKQYVVKYKKFLSTLFPSGHSASSL